jgi:energy-converting hydrogenase Eha subunit A
MAWLQQYAWSWFAVLAGVIAVVGVAELASGGPIVTIDNVQALTGMTSVELAAKSSDAYRLIEFNVRVEGLHLILIGFLMGAIVFYSFRQDQRWAWWAMWSFPLYTVSLLVLNLIVKTAPGQAPAAQAFTGAIVGMLSALVLLVSAPRFFSRPSRT